MGPTSFSRRAIGGRLLASPVAPWWPAKERGALPLGCGLTVNGVKKGPDMGLLEMAGVNGVRGLESMVSMWV